ncbi:unnamed protein product [Hermetia illucens]|uniref:Carbohydrate sulfotransferase n=2 Tax=Hermetia illucens TaxID=343691 RepID=A0A7R8UDP7_HERIL|nr:unnamed protein product [Hermetia illucens]
MLKILCSIRRPSIYLKYFGAISLVIFYFTFLFRESLHAYEINKGGSNLYKEENRPKSIPKRSRLALGRRYPEVNNNPRVITTRTLTTVNPIYEYSEELHSAIENELLARKSHLWDVCIRENIIGIYPPNAWEFFLSPGHNLVWCNVFKAASSTWMYYFNILGGYDIKYLQRTKTSPLELARKRFPRPKSSELIDSLYNSVSFLIVREPFERLLSAYRDKLEGCRNKYYKVLGKQIVRQFRNDSELKRHNTGPTFKEFLLFLIQSYKTSKPFDEHWTPVYKFCTPCSINYTLIAKVETLQRDTDYIIRQAGLEALLLGKLPKSRMRKISNRAAHNTRGLIEKYFSQVDRKTLDEIINIYRLDFELFNYNLTKYYDIVQPIPTTTPAVRTTSSTTPYSSSSSSSIASSTRDVS